MPAYLIAHIVFMSLMVILIIHAIVFSLRKKKNWYKKHKIFNTAGIFSGIIGFLIIFIEKLLEKESHFITLHSKTGLITLILLSLTLTGGFLMKKLPEKMKKNHKISGFISFILALITVFLGISLII